MNINFKGGDFNFKFFNQIRLDFVQWVHGQWPDSPWTEWTLSSLPGLAGLCPGCPWTMSRLSTESMDNVHWIHEHCPVWLVSLDFVYGLTGICSEYPWTLSRLSTESMVNVHWVHGQCPRSPLSPWTFYRWVVMHQFLSICNRVMALDGLWLMSEVCFRSVSWEQIDGFWPNFALAFILARSRSGLLPVNFY